MAELITTAGGTLPFSRFMGLALHDPDHGAYGAGGLRIGPGGDFVTSPSLGSDFAELLARQVIDWLEAMAVSDPDRRLSLVEVGGGEGQLAHDLLQVLARHRPDRLHLLEVVLVESNPGMESRQRDRLSALDTVSIRFCSLEDLAKDPVHGVILAHELLDALPVERLIWRGGQLQRLAVTLDAARPADQPHLQWTSAPLDEELASELSWFQETCGVALPPPDAPEGWTTEWHGSLRPWLQLAARALQGGMLLVIDYALEAHRYYSASRSAGTLMAYRGQQADPELLSEAGQRDLTAHLCLDSLLAMAQEEGWYPHGHCRQGQALLSLGLAQRLHALQTMPASELAEVLRHREALLRLVDPAGLGEFRWISLERRQVQTSQDGLTSRFLMAPDDGTGVPSDSVGSPLR